jgi:hypothetical protein
MGEFSDGENRGVIEFLLCLGAGPAAQGHGSDENETAGSQLRNGAMHDRSS